MGPVSAAKLLVAGAAWRVGGVDAAGRALVAAATSAEPDARVMGGILLTRAGDRSVPLLREALAGAAEPGTAEPGDPADVPAAVLTDVLASIGTDAARAALASVAATGAPGVAAAAREALRSLDQQRGLGG